MRVILVGVDYNRDNRFEYYMSELANLADACGYEVVDTITQKLQKFDPKHYLGSGKVVDLIEMVKFHSLDLVIVNDELKGSQNRNIEQLVKCPVMDRTQLILEIFATRANTKEAKLQVSIAQLKYQKPRMIGSYDNLSRQGGGKAGTVSRGGGETKLELDRRKIDNQIALYEKELDKFKASRTLQRERRMDNDIPIVSIVGYTNAGKSTLLNHLVEDKKVFEKDMLFATLDVSVRKIILDNNQQFLLVDTVGFVSNLPHELVKAFRSTLEEASLSDLIIHLTDISDPDQKLHETVVVDTLTQLEANEIPTLVVENKIDLKEDYELSERIGISAKSGRNMNLLLSEIKGIIFKDYEKVTLRLPYNNLGLIYKLNEYTYVSEVEYDQNGAVFETILSPVDRQKYSEYIK